MQEGIDLVSSYHRKNVPKWDRVRVERLCAFLEISVRELSALIMCPPLSMEKYMNSSRFSGPVKLWLTQLERLSLRGAAPDVAAAKVVPLHLFALQGRADCPVCGKEII